MPDYTEMIEDEIQRINRRARLDRKKIRSLSPNFEYSSYCWGVARVKGVCENFEEYLDISADLPANNELYSYDLYWHQNQDDSVVIKHRVKLGKEYDNYIDYAFIVKDPARTLDLLTEGKCKIVERTTTPQKPTTYTALSCEDNGR